MSYTKNTAPITSSRAKSLVGWIAITTASLLVSVAGVASASSTGVIPGDGPQCRLIAPATASFNTVLQPSLTLNLTSQCTRYPVLWEWTAPPLDYTNRNLTGQNALFAPLFASNAMRWTYDNRKVTSTNVIPITFTATGTYTFATRAKDADYIPPNNQPAGFWGPWGAAGTRSIDESGAWTNITLTCQPQSETRNPTPGGPLACPGGQISTVSETRTFCADSVTPTWSPWTTVNTCACPVGTTWNGSVCVPVPTCTVTPTPPIGAPGTNVTWSVTCDTPASTVTWIPTDPPSTGITPCASGMSCSQTYPDPDTVCYAVRGTNGSGQGPTSTPACATITCPAPQIWSAVQRACGVPPTISSPTFLVGQPQPSSIPLTITGTPTLTCSASLLPVGWTMSPTCQLTSVNVGQPQPSVPAGCTVTVVNAWGSDTKPCLEVLEPAPSCETWFESSPITLSQTNYVTYRSENFNPYPTGAIVFDGDRVIASQSGNAQAAVFMRNADSYTVSCAGGTVASQEPIDRRTGVARFVARYEQRNALTAGGYAGYLPVNGVTRSYVNANSSSTWISYITPEGEASGQWLNAPIYYSQSTNQTASAAPAQAACTVTVTKASNGQTASCSTPNVPTAANTGAGSCSLDIKMVEFVTKRYFDPNNSTRVRTEAGYSPSIPLNDVISQSLNTDMNYEFTPNRVYLDATLRTRGTQLQNAPFMPPGNFSASLSPFRAPTLSCQKRVKSRNNLTPAWSSFSVPFFYSASNNQVSASGDLSNASFALTLAQPFVGFGTYSPVYNNPTSWSDTFDSINEEYEVECSYAGLGYNGQTGATENVSCSARFVHTPGAACRPDAAILAGASGTRYANGSAAYTGYSAGWNGNIRYVGEKLTLTGRGGADYDSTFPPVALQGQEQPKINSIIRTAAPLSLPHIIEVRPGDLFAIGSTRGFLINNSRSLSGGVYGPWRYTDANIWLAGDVVHTTPLGTLGFTNTPNYIRGCSGQAFNTGYSACLARADFDVERMVFPGTPAARLSKTSCSIWAGETDGYTGGPGNGTPPGAGTTFGPGTGNGGTSGGTGTGGGGTAPGRED
jgi:hypothetical protein